MRSPNMSLEDRSKSKTVLWGTPFSEIGVKKNQLKGQKKN